MHKWILAYNLSCSECGSVSLLPIPHSTVDVVAGREFDALGGTRGDGALSPSEQCHRRLDSGKSRKARRT